MIRVRAWLLGIVTAALVLPAVGAEHARDREWAEAMLALRRQYRASPQDVLHSGQAGRPSIEMSITGKVFQRMLADFPYRTDWLLQDCGEQLEPWLNQTGVAAVERDLLASFPGLDPPTGDTDDPRWLRRYARAAAQRRIRRLDRLPDRVPRIVFTRNHTIEPSFFAYTEGQSDAQAERHFTPGTALCMLEWEGAYARVVDLIQDPYGRIRDPEVSFDGETILFAWKKSDRLDDYHLYELDLATSRIRQLTYGLGVADFEPCYLPSGDIVFSSSRCVQTVDCWWTEVSNLYTCGPNGEYLRRLGFDQVHTTTPSLLDDGRVIYTRWDYNDRGQVFPQGLFQMNPDGTGQSEFYGNNSWFPTTLSHARGIPGSPRVVATAHGHHTWQAGELVQIDVSRGRQEAAGVQLIAPVRTTTAVRVDQYGQEGDLFQYPYPITDREFLVAYSPLGGRPTRFSIYYMDIDGNRELLVSDPAISCQHPVPLVPRRRPAVRPSTVDYTCDSGAYYMQDIYVGPGLAGVDRGTIAKLRVVALDFRAAGVGQNGSTGPAGGALASTPISVGNGAWDVKRILGTAAVHPDGSAFFAVPAHTPVYFQALDHQGQAVQTMRSWSTLMPGEKASCVGCHEDKNSAPPPQASSLAMRAGLQQLEPFHGPPRGFSFSREIQPILDARCIACHHRDDAVNLEGTEVVDAQAKRRWTTSYLTLTSADPGQERTYGNANGPHCTWISVQSAPSLLPPYHAGSAVSPLIALLREGHEGVELTPEELEKLSAWIDLGVPFCGEYTEANAWTPEERAFYDRYLAKREFFAAQDEANIRALITDEPIRIPGSRNPYRNLAREASASAGGHPGIAVRDAGDGPFHPAGVGTDVPAAHASANHSSWLRLTWESDVYIDRVQIHPRTGPDGAAPATQNRERAQGRILLSTGRSLPFTFRPVDGAPSVAVPVGQWPPEPIQWIQFTDLVPTGSGDGTVAEVEIMGRATPNAAPD